MPGVYAVYKTADSSTTLQMSNRTNTTAIQFYESLGAKPMDEWTVYRLDAEALEHLGG